MIPSAPLGTEAAAGPHGPGGAATGADPRGPAAERRFRFELAAHPGSPAQARRLTRARLTGWSVCEDTCDTAALVVSELVTNAIVHTASRHVVCELYDRADLVRIAVRDEGCAPGQPQPSAPRQPEDEHGRGLLLVDALCHSWGAQEHGPGLLVWAELPRSAEGAKGPDRTSGTNGINRTDGPDGPSGPVGTDGPDASALTAVPPAPLTVPEPRGDLGWGTRPKPGSPDEGPVTPGDPGDPDGPGDPADRDETHTRTEDAAPVQAYHGQEPHRRKGHRPEPLHPEPHHREPHRPERHATQWHGTGGERL